MPNIGFEIKRKCKVCGEVFLAKTLDSQYCSPKCSKVAWKRKKDAKAKDAKLETIAHHIPDFREYISVREAVPLFGVERTTLYRLIHSGRIPSINVGKRLTRIKRADLEQLFHTRQESICQNATILISIIIFIQLTQNWLEWEVSDYVVAFILQENTLAAISVVNIFLDILNKIPRKVLTDSFFQ